MADNEFLNQVGSSIASVLLSICQFIISIIFYNRIVATMVFLVFINFVAIILMKRDKKYAETEQRRIRESTLLLVALVGGSLGMYFAMFKYKHKTLHPQFAIGVPTIICLQCALISCLLLSRILVV